jgi:hypothetical protein
MVPCPRVNKTTHHHQLEQPSCSTVQNRPAHAVHLQQGLTNPEYKSTQQDLTDEKGGEDSGMQA